MKQILGKNAPNVHPFGLLPILGYIAFALSLLFIILGCGGGTGGTGDIDATKISGRIVDLAQAALAGVKVTVVETGDSALSDATGAFEIETLLPGSELDLTVQTDTADASVNLGLVPGTQKSIAVVLQLDEDNNELTLISSNIPPTPAPEISPNPTSPSSTSTLAANPTKKPDSSATVSIAPTHTPTSVPTPSSAGTIFQGVVLRVDGTPYRNYPITVLPMGVTVTGDSNGRFSIETASIGGDITFKFGSRDTSPTAVLADVPAHAVVVDLTLRNVVVDIGPPTVQSLTIEAVTIEDR